MPTLRGANDTTVQTPLLLIGIALLLLLVMTFLRYTARQRRTKQRFHEPLQSFVGTGAPAGVVLNQLSRRKEDLNRFIDRLRAQLAVREEQLRHHDELEEIVTSRVETSRQQDKSDHWLIDWLGCQEWRKIMKAGKKLHGKNWNASNGDQPSLRELMELHKDELLEYKDSVSVSGDQKHSARNGGNATSRGSRIMQLPVSQSIPIITRTAREQRSRDSAPGSQFEHSQQPTGRSIPAKVVPPQWQSTRRVAGSVASPRQGAPSTGRDSSDGPRGTEPTSDGAGTDLFKPTLSVPPLDFSKLSSIGVTSNSTTTSSSLALKQPKKKDEDDDNDMPRKSFEMTFQRQAKFATMLKKK